MPPALLADTRTSEGRRTDAELERRVRLDFRIIRKLARTPCMIREPHIHGTTENKCPSSTASLTRWRRSLVELKIGWASFACFESGQPQERHYRLFMDLLPKLIRIDSSTALRASPTSDPSGSSLAVVAARRTAGSKAKGGNRQRTNRRRTRASASTGGTPCLLRLRVPTAVLPSTTPPPGVLGMTTPPTRFSAPTTVMPTRRVLECTGHLAQRAIDARSSDQRYFQAYSRVELLLADRIGSESDPARFMIY